MKPAIRQCPHELPRCLPRTPARTCDVRSRARLSKRRHRRQAVLSNVEEQFPCKECRGPCLACLGSASRGSSPTRPRGCGTGRNCHAMRRSRPMPKCAPLLEITRSKPQRALSYVKVPELSKIRGCPMATTCRHILLVLVLRASKDSKAPSTVLGFSFVRVFAISRFPAFSFVSLELEKGSQL